ncbi:MAG: hypothetical protein GF331_09730 [Chitinivibrionales bacterium]|nr:hypothetical protein [Chitinivibrionales bacterium]
MNAALRGAVVLLVILCGVSLAGRARAELTWRDSTYEIHHSFSSGCPRDTLYEVFHKPAHMRRYLTDANLEIVVHDSSRAHNDITYIYRYFISRLELRFSRRIERDERMVSFTLTTSASYGSAIIPKVLRVYGYYRVADSAGTRKVDYYQKTTLDRDLNPFYIFFIRRDTDQFLVDLEQYLATIESKLQGSETGHAGMRTKPASSGDSRAIDARTPSLREPR